MGKSHKDNKTVSRSKRQFKRRFAEIEHDLESDLVGEELAELLTGDEDDEDSADGFEPEEGVTA